MCEGFRSQLAQQELSAKAIVYYWLTLRRVKSYLPLLSLFLCLTAMFMTGSRAGIVLSLISFVIATTAFFYRDLRRATSVLSLLGIGGLTALGVLQIMGAGVNGRFNAIGLADEGRLEGYRSTIRMIADHPWFGTGLGTFVWNFPAYRSSNISMVGIWDRAHDTLLELAAEMGVPLATLVVFAWVVAFALLIRGTAIRRRDHIVPTVALSVAFIAVMHSFVEFSLQTAGTAIIIFALVGAGLAQSFGSKAHA